MKRVLPFILCAALMCSCQAQQEESSEVDIEAVERVVRDFFHAIAINDYDALRDHCTEDFIIFETGQVMYLEQFIDLLQSFEGQGSIQYSLEDLQTQASGTFAWMTLRNRAVVKSPEQTNTLEWLESAVLKKENQLWKLVFYHSTPVEEQTADEE